jgi:hypothetical protein
MLTAAHRLEAAAILAVRELFGGAEPRTTLAFMSSDQSSAAS